jgi:hypothetical protein
MLCSVRREEVLGSSPVFDRVARVQQRGTAWTEDSGERLMIARSQCGGQLIKGLLRRRE